MSEELQSLLDRIQADGVPGQHMNVQDRFHSAPSPVSCPAPAPR